MNNEKTAATDSGAGIAFPAAPDVTKVTSLISDLEDRVRQLKEVQKGSEEAFAEVQARATQLDARGAELDAKQSALEQRETAIESLKREVEAAKSAATLDRAEATATKAKAEALAREVEELRRQATADRDRAAASRKAAEVAEADWATRRARCDEEWKSIELRRKAQDALAEALESERRRLDGLKGETAATGETMQSANATQTPDDRRAA